MFLPIISVATRNPLNSICVLKPLFQGQKTEGKDRPQPSSAPVSGEENFQKKKFWWGILPLTLASIFSPVATIATYKAMNPTPLVVQVQQNRPNGLESLEFKLEYLNEFYVKASQPGTLENAYMEWGRAYEQKAHYMGHMACWLIVYPERFQTDQARSLMKAPAIEQLYRYAQKVYEVFPNGSGFDNLSQSFFPETRTNFKVYLSLAEKLSPEIQKCLENELQHSTLTGYRERILASEAAYQKAHEKLALAVKGDPQKQKALQEMNQIFWQLPLNLSP